MVVGLAIIAYPAIKLIQDSRTRNQAITEIGVAASAASCDATDERRGLRHPGPQGGRHRDPVRRVAALVRARTTPTGPRSRRSSTRDDRPPVPNLVHNLEHGYTILWYNEATAKDKDQVALIEKLSKAKMPDSSNGKFIAAPFRAADGAAWPAGKNIAFSHWSGNAQGQTTAFGHRQFCGSLSGEALKQFMDKYPSTDAQEPNGG